MITSPGSSASQLSRQRSRISGSSRYDGTMTDVVVRKSLSIGFAVCDRKNLTSQIPQESRPTMPSGINLCQCVRTHQ
jgi:hypothetical protein